MTTAKLAIAEARQHLGVTESPIGSNRQKFGKWYKMDGVAWCVIFQSYVAYQIGLRFKGATTNKGFSACTAVVNWAKKNSRWYPRGQGKPGDWAIIDWPDDGTKGPQHVELAVSIRDGKLRSIGGNTSKSSVAERTMKEACVIGYMRPPYDSSGTTSSKKVTPLTDRILRYTKPVMTGSDVKRVQQRLRDLGYSLAVDGSFGPETQKVVKAFQRVRGLTVDGIVGPETLASLQG